MQVNTMTYLFFLNQSSNRAIPTRSNNFEFARWACAQGNNQQAKQTFDTLCRCSRGAFVLAFMVEIMVRYNSFMHKTQPRKLIFLFFMVFLISPTPTPNLNLPFKYKHTGSTSIMNICWFRSRLMQTEAIS
jgi:hypothetical protein